jgi:hypothetical protein
LKRTVALVAWLVSALVLAPGNGSDARTQFEHDEDGYVAATFRRQIGELPRMGWFTPDGRFAAAERHDSLVLYADRGAPRRVAYVGPVNGVTRTQMRERFLSCETRDDEPLFAFTGAPHGPQPRALFMTRPFPGDVRGGITRVSLAPPLLQRIISRLGWDAHQGIRQDEAYAVRPDSPFYSFHRLYDRMTKELTHEALTLHDVRGRLVAHEQWAFTERDLCDGCGLPTATDPGGYAYRLQNIFELPGFAYPVLLLDTSTIEGRALSLRTFSPDGRASALRVYEYAFTCGLPAQ